MWQAEIKAPQAGPVYVHHEQGLTVFAVLNEIALGYDFERADSVTITITREAPPPRPSN